MTIRFDRRTALKGLGALPLAYACGDAATERPLREVIDTVVVLMMENRSFDHYFGSLSLSEGRTDVDGLTASMGNPNAAGEIIAPYHETPGCYADPPHNWNASRAQLAEGACNGFVKEMESREGVAEAHRVMGFYDRTDLPVLYALADEYALCQKWHSSVLGPTWPNRFYLFGAQSNGVMKNDFEAEYTFPTIFDRLQRSRLDFGMYYGNLSLTWMLGNDFTGHYRELQNFYDSAAAGTLPSFSLVEPIYGRNDDHPPAHPLAGQLMIASVYDALAKSPQWGRSMMIVTYDEHGGFHDHVAPPKTADDRAAEGFDQLGFRVPAVVMGPYVKKGVSSTLFDHTSVLAFTEGLFDLAPLTARDGAANNLSSLLDQDRLAAKMPAAPITLPVVTANEAEIFGEGCVFSPFGGLLASGGSTGQIELERHLETHPRGTLDRRNDTDAIYSRLLSYYQRRGLVKFT